MSYVYFAIFGLVVGIIARFLMPGPQPMGIILTALLGVAGSFLGGWLGSLIHGGPADAMQPSGWIGSIVGSLVLLFIYGVVLKRRSV
jgi:uncharacterized membrane protein YeaQ/YmgE (transglycosylase-associated protein family)